MNQQRDILLQSSIAQAARRDSEDMKYIAVLGSIFLPASLVAVSILPFNACTSLTCYNRGIDALAKIFVYSMTLDGPIREADSHNTSPSSELTGFLAGSRALDALDKLITSTESYFHPSNAGHWTFSVRHSQDILICRN